MLGGAGIRAKDEARTEFDVRLAVVRRKQAVRQKGDPVFFVGVIC